MRTHTTLEVIDMLLANKEGIDDHISVSAGFLMRVQAELNQLEDIAMQVVNIHRGAGINLESEQKKLVDMALKWDRYE